MMNKLGEKRKEPSVQFLYQCGAVSKVENQGNAVIYSKNA